MAGKKLLLNRKLLKTPFRFYSGDPCENPNKKKGLVIGAYDGCKTGELKFTSAGSKMDGQFNNKLSELIKGSGLKLGEARVYNGLGNYYGVAVAGCGQEGLGYNEGEVLNDCKENIRVAAGAGVRALQSMNVTDISVEGFTNAEAAAEGATLAAWKFQHFKNKDNRSTVSKVQLHDDPDTDGWARGYTKAQCQNVARELEQMPANRLTPSMFAMKAIEILCPCGVQVDVRDMDWLEAKAMNSFIKMTKSSCEPPLLLEISYCGGGAEDKPVVLVGKGVTFDSGALCLKKCKGMSEYRADMAGAAVIVGVMKALASLHVPMNVNAIIPLCENMPGGQAIKPGDVMRGLNGKTIRVQDPSKEGRVVVADALTYCAGYKPCLVTNIATLTKGVMTALGGSSTGVFCTSEVVWNEIKKAGAETGDRVWRLPLWRYFSKKVTDYVSVDVNNVGSGRGGDPCLGAAFLLQFAPPVDFMHLDIMGTGRLATSNSYVYLRKGLMTGRPTRTVTQFLYQMACPMDKTSC